MADVSTETLGSLQEKGDRFTKLAIVETKRKADLEDAIRYISNESDKYRSMAKKIAIEVMNIHVLTPNPAYQRADGVNIGREAEIASKKSLMVLEGKLNKLLQRQSQIQNTNKEKKKLINHYRTLRIQTDSSHSRLEMALGETKGKIEFVLGESDKIVEEREKFVEKKEMLEKINLEEQAKFVEEYERMGKYIVEQNTALENSMLQDRKQANKDKATNRQKKDGDDTFKTTLQVSDLSLEDEIMLVKEVGELSTQLMDEEKHLAELRTKIANYEAMFEQLKRMTQVDEIEEMVSTYTANEEEMFSMYNYNQSINEDYDKVLEQNEAVEKEIKRYKEEQESQEELRKHSSDDMQQRLTNALELTSQLEEQNQMQQETILQISKKVSNLFFKLQCDQVDAKANQSKSSKDQNYSNSKSDGKVAFLISQGVSESNVLEFMGCIEQRAVDIVSNYLRVVAKEGTNFETPAPRSPTPGPSTRMSWRGNGTGFTKDNVDFGIISDDDLDLENIPEDKPLDLENFKTKLHKKLGMATNQTNIFRSSRDSSDMKRQSFKK